MHHQLQLAKPEPQPVEAGQLAEAFVVGVLFSLLLQASAMV